MPDLIRYITKTLVNPGNIKWQNIFVISLTAAFLVASSYYLLFPVLKNSETNVENLQNNAAASARELLTLFINLTFEDLVSFGQQLQDEPDKSEKLSSHFLESRKDFINVAVLSPDGKNIGKIGKNSLTLLTFEITSSAPFFKNALQDKKYISPIFFTGEGPILQIAAPIKQNDKISAIVSAEIDLSLLWRSVEKSQISDGKIYVVDDRGYLIADPDPQKSRAGENLRYREIVNDLIENKPLSHHHYKNENGIEVVATGIKMPETNWSIIVEQDASKALIQKNQTLFLGIIFAAISALLIFLIARTTVSITRSYLEVQKIREEIERILEYMPNGVIEYTGENEIISINPSAKEYLNIEGQLPPNIKILQNSPLSVNYDKLWSIFYQKDRLQEGGQAKSFEITFTEPTRRVLKVITVYVKGIGEPSEQRYLKILHDITLERPE